VIPIHLDMAAARRIAAVKRVALLLVERDGCLVGYVNERALASTPDEAPVADFLTRLDRCLQASMSTADARRCFIAARAAVLPVVAAGSVLGAIARGDIERHHCARAPHAGRA
jgi:predicted transcriptional regulator